MGRYKISMGCLACVAVLLSILLASKQEPLPEYHEQKEIEPAVEQAPLEMYDYYFSYRNQQESDALPV